MGAASPFWNALRTLKSRKNVSKSFRSRYGAKKTVSAQKLPLPIQARPFPGKQTQTLSSRTHCQRDRQERSEPDHVHLLRRKMTDKEMSLSPGTEWLFYPPLAARALGHQRETASRSPKRRAGADHVQQGRREDQPHAHAANKVEPGLADRLLQAGRPAFMPFVSVARGPGHAAEVSSDKSNLTSEINELSFSPRTVSDLKSNPG